MKNIRYCLSPIALSLLFLNIFSYSSSMETNNQKFGRTESMRGQGEPLRLNTQDGFGPLNNGFMAWVSQADWDGDGWNDLGIDFNSSFQDTKNRSFYTSSTTSFAFNSFWAEVRFVYFYFTMEGKFTLTILCDPFPEQPHITVNRTAVKINERGNSLSI